MAELGNIPYIIFGIPICFKVYSFKATLGSLGVLEEWYFRVGAAGARYTPPTPQVFGSQLPPDIPACARRVSGPRLSIISSCCFGCELCAKSLLPR